jgi:hypothetical protein
VLQSVGISVMNLGEKTIVTKSCELLMASVVVIEFQTKEAYSSLDLITVQYKIYKEPRKEKGKVIVRTRPSNLIH